MNTLKHNRSQNSLRRLRHSLWAVSLPGRRATKANEDRNGFGRLSRAIRALSGRG